MRADDLAQEQEMPMLEPTSIDLHVPAYQAPMEGEDCLAWASLKNWQMWTS